STVCYHILDQLQKQLPYMVTVSEQWTGSVHQKYPGTNWIRGDDGGNPQPPQKWCDEIQGQAGELAMPKAQVPQNPLGSTDIDYWDGIWRVGSITPGLGAEIQTNKWWKYQAATPAYCRQAAARQPSTSARVRPEGAGRQGPLERSATNEDQRRRHATHRKGDP